MAGSATAPVIAGLFMFLAGAIAAFFTSRNQGEPVGVEVEGPRRRRTVQREHHNHGNGRTSHREFESVEESLFSISTDVRNRRNRESEGIIPPINMQSNPEGSERDDPQIEPGSGGAHLLQ